MKQYIISSTVLKTKEAATKRILGWANSGDLVSGCRVYEVEVKQVYQPQVRKSIVLEEL